MKIKSINALMKYLRDVKHISITGSTQKSKLRRIGYYHGYKGYRFFTHPSNCIPYTDFEQLMSVYSFDMQIKALLYTPLMQLETTLKNYALEEMVSVAQSDRFTDVFSSVLNHHKDYPKSSDQHKKTLSKELGLRNSIYHDLSRDYGSKLVVQHFYEKDLPVPIWAIFEIISLGEFGTLLSCVNDSTVSRISNSCGINVAFNANGRLLEKLVFAVKDLRNAVAHNDPVFDVRFKSAKLNQQIPKLLSSETGIKNLNFSTIVDYIVLLVYLMKILKFPIIEIKKTITGFSDCCEDLRKRVPANIFATIIHTDTRGKLQQLIKYL